MSKTPSTMLPLGTIAPDIELTNVINSTKVKLRQGDSFAATVIMFLCNHCPFVRHVNAELTKLANDYIPKNIRFIAISSNDVDKYPVDSPENMVLHAEECHYPFPYLFDETQEVAKAYQAACTPDFYVFNSELALVYRGQLDDSRPGNEIPVTGSSIREALDCLLENRPLNSVQKASLGCNIKWRDA